MQFRALLHSLVCVLGLSMAGIVTATYIITDDIVDPNPNPVIYPVGSTFGPTSYMYWHDITDNGWLSGGSLVSASLTILLRDGDAGNEYFKFVIGSDLNQVIDNLFSVNSNPAGEAFGAYLLNIAALAELNSFGRIPVTIQSVSKPQGQGKASPTSFIFDMSTLNVTAGSGPRSSDPDGSGPVDIGPIGIGPVDIGPVDIGPVGTGPGASGTVPEPSLLLLLCLGFAMLIWYARRGPVAG